ncbi:MAG TPA: hypothetical protein VN328_08440 [Thermodesulfovibrionales bacterium]|nr:hypothetical protein [Thermodesulfovibrionales bacterium]
MKRFGWQIRLGLILLASSALIYSIHYAIFRDAHHIFFYLIGDIAFIPIEVLIVSLIIHRMLEVREKRMRLEKLNMVIGVFFSEMGTNLLTYFSDCDPKLDDIRKDLIVTNNWSEEEFVRVNKHLRNYDYGVDIKKVDWASLRSFLIKERDFVLRLLENPYLLEHEAFTDLLHAVLHLSEELSARKDIHDLPGADLKHIGGDLRRAYVLLVHQWLEYMKHLKENFPYLFSLAMRTNPFDENASPLVTS